MDRDEKHITSVSLDWSRLLGFDQVSRKGGDQPATLEDARLTKVGAKPCMIRNLVMVGRKDLSVRRGPS